MAPIPRCRAARSARRKRDPSAKRWRCARPARWGRSRRRACTSAPVSIGPGVHVEASVTAKSSACSPSMLIEARFRVPPRLVTVTVCVLAAAPTSWAPKAIAEGSARRPSGRSADQASHAPTRTPTGTAAAANHHFGRSAVRDVDRVFINPPSCGVEIGFDGTDLDAGGHPAGDQFCAPAHGGWLRSLSSKGRSDQVGARLGGRGRPGRPTRRPGPGHARRACAGRWRCGS